ncbi:hypothetical protein MLD38_010871 [Melastoma candidum]|uniref:Uncharacterized protein n=1 Tax=Melastoma candidum TaxID=119954 RepID=A0ACB9R2D1_9MYRT|nr:hypothetical protein MLD38_010871 [Melastoma candidum]
MPPRAVKRGGAASAKKTTPRSTRKSAVTVTEAVEEAPKAEEEAVLVEEEGEKKAAAAAAVGVDKEGKSEPVVDEPVVSLPESQRPALEEKVVQKALVAECDNGSPAMTKEEEEQKKEAVEEYGKDEKLDLEDNDPEYEPEEYDDKEMDGEEPDGMDREGEEEQEDVLLGPDEEGDVVEEELEDVQEELEAEEEDEHPSDERDHHELHDDEDEEHRDVFQERRKRKEFEVFVGGLDKDVTKDDLKKVFSSVGEVTEVRLMMNPQTKKNKGFAFLRFASVEQARKAVAELKNPVIKGKQCGVSPSQDNDTLFLGNICKSWTKEALKEKLKHYGIENIEDVTLVEDSNNLGMNRGFAFLEFSSRPEAMDAFRRLQRREVLFGVDRPARVSFADSFIDPGDEIMAQVKTVFVDGLPASWDEDRVRDLLKMYGQIEKIELARNMPFAKRKDYGFVSFDTHDAAVNCAKGINNTELGEGDSKAKVRARLSRPLQKGKVKHNHRGDDRSVRVSDRARGSWSRPASHSFSTRVPRSIGGRVSSTSLKRPLIVRDRRPVIAMPAPRARPLPPPAPRSYDRRPAVASYPKSSIKRDYGRREELPPPRSRPIPDYGSRVVPERRAPYRDEYVTRGSGYSDLPRSTSRTVQREYPDERYGQRFERPFAYRDGRLREYESLSGSKRPYSALDDAPPRYADPAVRPSRARVDYQYGSSSHYNDPYGDRLGRSTMGYGSSRSSMSSHDDSHGLYGSRSSMSYGGGSYSSSDVGGMYSSSYGGEYGSRGNNVRGGSYSSMHSSRGVGGSSYMGPGGSGSYY